MGIERGTRGLGINAKCLYEGVIVPTVRSRGMGYENGGEKKVNAFQMKCLKSLVGVSRMDRVRNEEVRRKSGIERELASRADQSVEKVWARGENG